MSSKLWICIALLSIFVAHCYVYTDVFKQTEIQGFTGYAAYLTEFGMYMDKTKEKLKVELKSLLEDVQKMTHKGRKMISNYRTLREQELAKRSK